ncbi:Two component system response regulator/histidine kinase [Desulfonema limicola]|uniref:histidine kinase n=1 Tax=Desulfonema limicola TaxID=45656 RepID=A0A975B3S3_9BACT|nr:ATP-binding protein [Desulfonema limicola]QTA78265.1 Two component system response regulator/histidine kinase [Desulfonema limicola]
MTRHKILVVEDEALVADDMAASLEDLGYNVTSIAASGKDAIESARREPPDLVLMDIFLKGELDGIETAHKILSIMDIPVIYVTAYADEKILERAKITEPFGYLVKPFHNRDLHINISMALYKAEITARLKKMEKELSKAKKLEAAAVMAGGVAHDFNNLLFAILGNISLAKEGFEEGEDISGYLDTAEKTILHARDLTNKFINFASKAEPYKTPLSIAHLIENVCKDFERKTGMQCRILMSDPECKADADYAQIFQALANIIENAGEHVNNDTGTINIKVDNIIPFAGNIDMPDNNQDDFCMLKNCKYIRISIKDNGSGIKKEDISRVFDPYYSTKERGARKGMGLGLAVAYSIIDRHEGCIKIQSKPGSGTEVCIFIPASAKSGK